MPRHSAIATAIAAVATASGALAQDPTDLALGEKTYFEACAGCHGDEALGDGPMTEILTVAVPDLTGLAARNGGEFPWLRVIHTIDGRSGLRGHGGPMPIFGMLFSGDTAVADAPDGTPVIASARVLALVKYLESLQDGG
jgi:mono/diheme cytochrome c family protein